jgi:maltose operon protein
MTMCRYVPKQRILITLNRIIVIVWFMVIVSGCSVPYVRTISQYQNAAICCGSMDKFSFEVLEIGDTKSFDLSETSPAYQFLTGKSYFKAFLLPLSSYPYVVTIRSYMLGGNIDSAYIFFPQVITLDENYEIIRSTDPRNFKLQKAGFFETAGETWGLMYKLEGEISFSKDNETEKYLIVLTTDELLQTKTALSTWRTAPIVLPGVVGALPVGTKEVLIPHSPAGRIRISFRPQDKGATP